MWKVTSLLCIADHGPAGWTGQGGMSTLSALVLTAIYYCLNGFSQHSDSIAHKRDWRKDRYIFAQFQGIGHHGGMSQQVGHHSRGRVRQLTILHP